MIHGQHNKAIQQVGLHEAEVEFSSSSFEQFFEKFFTSIKKNNIIEGS